MPALSHPSADSSNPNSGDKKPGIGNPSQTLQGRPLPNSLDAEQGLLAACIVDTSGEVIGRCMEQSISSDHFYEQSHQLIFEALLLLNKDNLEADEILLSDKLSDLGNLERIGGREFIINLTSRIETIAHAPFWLDIVKQKAILRKCIYVAFEIIDDANQLQGNIDDFLSGIEQRVCSLGDQSNVRASVPFREPVNHAMEQIQRMLSHEEMDGLLTGYKDLDNLTNGFKPGEMIVLAARPSVGKTSLAMNIVENIAFSKRYEKNPKNILVYSLEMSATSLAMRMICGRARVNMNDLRRGFVRKDYAEKLNSISKEFQKHPCG